MTRYARTAHPEPTLHRSEATICAAGHMDDAVKLGLALRKEGPGTGILLG